MKKIKTIKQLKNACKDNMQNFFVLLNGGLRSSKEITWDGRIFVIYNNIDGSDLCLLPEQLFDEELTIIGRAMKAGAFYQY